MSRRRYGWGMSCSTVFSSASASRLAVLGSARFPFSISAISDRCTPDAAAKSFCRQPRAKRARRRFGSGSPRFTHGIVRRTGRLWMKSDTDASLS
jgi:hypothetical protein